MKYILLLPLTLFHLFCFSQAVSSKDSIAKYKIKQENITALEYEAGKQIKKRFTEIYYDENGNTIRYNAMDENKKITSFSISEYSKDGLYEKFDQYEANGIISSSSISITDTLSNIRYHYVMRNGDTSIIQKRYYDRNGYDSILYTKIGKTGLFKVTGEWHYDDSGKLITSNYSYSSIKNSIVFDTTCNCTIEYNKDNQVISKKYKKPNEIVKYFYLDDTVGYNYGIAFHSLKGGRSLRRYDNMGLEKEIIYEDKKGKLLAKVTFEYK